MLEKYLILLCAAALLSAERLPPLEGRIVGGDYVPIEKVPWQVALLNDGVPNCGGSIYNTRVIVTAAHCGPFDIKRLTVRAGSSLKQFGGQLVSVHKAIEHENYVSEGNRIKNDIALLILASPLELGPAVQPIELAEKSPLPGTDVLVTGWGALHDRPFLIYKEILLGTNVTIVNYKDCYNAYRSINITLSKTSICEHAIGSGSCRGDSGGPVVTMHDRRLIGIVSGVNKCAGELPTFHTDVAVLRKWIIRTAEKYLRLP